LILDREVVMLKLMKNMYKYRNVMPELDDFTDTVIKANGNGLQDKSEKSEMMKKYWVLVKSIQKSI
tara:strand:+ start:195 stop:392 length:198 start_codon:yes stop_codon:yes gene_type:complete